MITDAGYRMQDARTITCNLKLASSILFIFLTGCSISYGVYHEVKKGQTLWRIAKAYNVDLQDIAEINNITDVTQIEAGQKIFIPGAERVLEVKPHIHTAQGSRVKGQEKDKEEAEGKIIIEKGRFIWPVKGEIVSHFGIRDGKKHDGIDISASPGTEVVASDDGKVIYCGERMRGYGNLIIIQHRDNFVTIYAHNRENLVKVGQDVKKGEMIAMVGNSGNSTGYHLHFEVRKNNRPRNPIFFLP